MGAEVGQLILQGAFFPAVVLMGVEVVHVGGAQSPQSSLRFYPFMSHSFHIIGQMDAGQHPVHPDFGQDDGLDDSANLVVGNIARNGTATVSAVTSAAGTFMFPVVSITVLVLATSKSGTLLLRRDQEDVAALLDSRRCRL